MVKILVKVVLVHRSIVNNNYQHDSRILHTLISNKSYEFLLTIFFKRHLIQNFYLLKHGLLIKTINHYR